MTAINDRKVYSVYKIQLSIPPGLADPNMPPGRMHNALFVTEDNAETSRARPYTGTTMEVVGSLASGFIFRSIPSHPESEETFARSVLLGRLHRGGPQDIEQVLDALPVPPRQIAWSVSSQKWEPCRPDGSFYKEDEERPAFWKCTEWTEDVAIPQLKQRGLLIE